MERHSQRLFRIVFVGLLISTSAVFADPTVLATVNGRPISVNDVQGDLFLNQLPEHATPEQRRATIERLIDRELIRGFLTRRKVVAHEDDVERQVQAIKRLLEAKNEGYEETLAKVGLTEESLRDYLALPIAWSQHVGTVLTESRIAEEWKQSGSHFDGTKVTASHIVRIVPKDAPDSDWQDAESLLERVRADVVAGRLTFAEAAQENSQSPSGKLGGSLGEFEYFGRIAESISRIAFHLPSGEISEPVRTPFGVHLIRVEKRTPGDLSLEDVRPQLIEQITKELWDDQVARERKSARIEVH
ncbi:MAG: peptidylprolyl isomerase [Planctomycetaceae bacterium]|nr:peptidylprolyl isomerase [Planctomycetaceae bacterium]